MSVGSLEMTARDHTKVIERDFRDENLFIPEQLRSERWIALATLLISFLYLWLFRRYTWIDPDEGIILQGAQRILDGQVLYRDFFSFFTPGSYYLLAICFRVFGDSIIVAHTLLAIFGAACSPLTYLLARRVCSRSTSLLVTGLVLVTAFPMRFVSVHNWDSTFLACVALYGSLRLVETRNAWWGFATGSFVCLTGLFEQSKGACLLLGIGAGLAIIAVLDRGPKILPKRNCIAAALGLAWPLIITIVYFASEGALSAMASSWLWPLEN